MVTLIVATTGFTIYQLNCQCTQTNQLSVIIETEHCNAADADCCQSSSSCCETNTQEKNDCACSSCDTPETHFVKLNTEFLISQTEVSETSFLIKTINWGIPELQISFDENKEVAFPFKDKSPPTRILSGKKIVTLLHRFKIDEATYFIS